MENKIKELEELKKQKNDIARRINELQNEIDNVNVGRAKFGVKKSGYTSDEYYICVKSVSHGTKRREGYRSLIRGYDKQKVIDSLGIIIQDLTALRDRVKE